MVAGLEWGYHCARRFRHLRLRNPHYPWHSDMQLVIRAIVVYWDVSVSASDHMFHKRHIGRQIGKKNSIVNTCCLRADDHSRHWVLSLLDLILDCSKSIFIHPLLGALR
jgi:hypothetical protein